MTPSSPSSPSRIDRDTAEARLANRLSAEAVHTALATPTAQNTDRDAGSRITYRIMHQLVTGTFEGDARPLLARISADFSARRQFRDILGMTAVARQDQQAAAASIDTGTTATRPGQMFDLIISPSSRNDGILYLQVKFHATPDGGTVSGPSGPDRASPTMLFADRSGQFALVRLPEIVDGTAQIMLDQSHDIVQAFRDPETEFFIR
ncbi:hypothetical protein AB3X55_08255 [Alphaproteobacteria bacterium LSUCC0719]|jgi:hypothetical protein